MKKQNNKQAHYWYQHLPNILTLLNLLAGIFAITVTFGGYPVTGAWFILIAFIFDSSDGTIARLLHAQSEIGRELDSLADLVSFGVAPAVILTTLLQQQMKLPPDYLSRPFGEWFVIWVPYIIPVFSALRLAKFNLDEDQRDKFTGLPTPANALIVLSFPLILKYQPDIFLANWLQHPWVIIVYSILISLALVAPLDLYSLKPKGFGWKVNRFRYLFILLALLLVILWQYSGLTLIVLLYLPVGWVLARSQKIAE